MTTETLTLTDFLLARITEDEGRARRTWVCTSPGEPGEVPDRRLLAECEAKRRIVEVVQTLGGHYEPNAARIAPGIIRYFAAVYADHPDFREEWRP